MIPRAMSANNVPSELCRLLRVSHSPFVDFLVGAGARLEVQIQVDTPALRSLSMIR